MSQKQEVKDNASIIKSAKIILRNDETKNWVKVEETVVLSKGEPAIEFTSDGQTKIKIGDGINVWKNLSYISASSEGEITIPDDFQKQIDDLNNLVSSFDSRIHNAGADASAAVLTAESAEAGVEELRGEMSTFSEVQNAALAEVQTLATESAATVEKMNATVENIKNNQIEQTMKIDATSTRMDTFIAAYTDQGAFDNAELVDMRTGYDGKTYTTAGAAVRQIGYDLNQLGANLEGALGKDIVDGLVYEGNQLYLTSGGEKVGDSVTITSGGTGGGINQTYFITLQNLLDNNRVFTITDEDECILKFGYYSIDEDGLGDGAGLGQFYVNGNLIATLNIPQGENSFDVTPYLSKGGNTVKIQVENTENARKILTYSIEVLVLSVTTTAPKMGIYTGVKGMPYTVTGSGPKTVHFIMDGLEFASEVVMASGGGRTIPVPEQLDGPHILQIYAETPKNGTLEMIRSNVLELGMLYYSTTTTTQAILLMDHDGPEVVDQGTTLVFPYLVYDPFLQMTEIKLNIYDEDGNLYSSNSLQVDQSPKEWSTQDYPSGKVTFEIVCKDAIATKIINVKPTSFDRKIITENCVLDFNARGRSNNEPNPDHWEYGNITAKFNGFGWANVDGWLDNNGQTVLRFLPGDSMSLNFQPFSDELRVNGYTIEAEFETHNVQDYDSVIVSATKGGRGFVIKSQSAELTSAQATISAQFKEDSHVRVSFVVEPLTINRFVYIYINGIMSKVIQYLQDDNFTQDEPVDIFIGAESCGLDLTSLRIYDRSLTRHEQLNNFICDRATLPQRIDTDERNTILDGSDAITIDTLSKSIPYIILECEQLPQYKGDKKKNQTVTFVDPLNPKRNFTAKGVQLDVQGTSSAGYPIKNYKVALKNGLTYTSSNKQAAGFPILEDGIEGSTICLKADFASSEQANNVMLVDYYEQLNPYKNPAQLANEKVRIGVRGFPCVVFWKNTKDNSINFIGKYNFNDDKSNENVFGFDRDIYPNCECWEVLNNDTARVMFQESEYENEITTVKPDGTTDTHPAWWDDFEARFPDLDDKYRDYTQLKRLTDWIASTNRGAVDSEEEKSTRLQKFKNEFEDYFIKEAMLFYYLFTEVFVLADSRAKNLFLTTFDGELWFPIPYDFDTAIGIDNTGTLIFEYDVEDVDIVNNNTVFSGQRSVLWNNV